MDAGAERPAKDASKNDMTINRIAVSKHESDSRAAENAMPAAGIAIPRHALGRG
jgi:hypothetical protein